MTDETLPTLPATKPIAVCGHCNNHIFPDGRCQAADPMPDACCMNGEDWKRMKFLRDMQNAWVR